MPTIRFLIPILCLLVLLVAIALSSASQLPWRTIDSIHTYNLGSLDPRPPKGYEQEWLKRVNHIYTVAHMYFYEDWKGRKPVFNYYLISQCPDEETNEIYRQTIRKAINDIMRYRDKFVELYPQFSYLLKLKLQHSDGPLYDSVFNIPIYVPSVCNESGLSVTSYAYYFEKIILNFYTSAYHEIVHTLGSGHLVYGSNEYYSFNTRWGWVNDIGDNTLSWYALALAWSWLRFYDTHPGLVSEDFASKLQMKLKYRTEVESGGGYFKIRYYVTAKDAIESGISVRPFDTFFKIELKGGAVIPVLALKPEEWMKGNPNFDKNFVDWIKDDSRLLLRTYNYFDSIKHKGVAWQLLTFTGLTLSWYKDHIWKSYNWYEHVFIPQKPPADDEKIRLLLFSDLRPDLFFCGYFYRWRGSDEEIFVPVTAIGNETHTPAMLPGRWVARAIECYYLWGPYIYRAPEFYTYPTRIAVGVPASEEIIYDSQVSRRVFKGKWLVNGTEWPGPYLDLDVMGWPIGDLKPWRWKWADGGCPPFTFPCPDVYRHWLTGPNGGPVYLDNFTRRYGGYERVPWIRGVIVLRVTYNTTLEPVYEREYLVNFTVPEGFRILYGDKAGWYKEGSKIRLPTLSELQISRGTKLVLDGWRDGSGRIYKPGDEVVIDGPKSFEPVFARYHLLSVKGPIWLKHEGSGWHKEGSIARLRVVENVTYASDATRYIFFGFKKDGEVVREVEVRVDGPVEIEAVWKREYKLVVSSRFLYWTFVKPWFEENSTYMLVIPGGLQDLGNGTLIEIKGIEVQSGFEVYKAERIRDQSINITVEGRRATILWNVTFTVHGPIKMKVHWNVKYALEVRAPPGTASMRNGSVTPPATVFIEEGKKVTLDFKDVHLTGDTSRLVLHDVIMDNRSLGPITSLEVEVKKPVSVIVVYRDQILVWPKLRGQDESIADPDLVVLRSDLGEVTSEGGKAVWLDRYLTLGLRSIEWKVVKAVYKGVDVTVNATVRAGDPGTIAIPAEISGLTVRVIDFLGMPVPFANVIYSGPGGNVKASTDYSGIARLGVVPNGQGRLSAGLIGASEGEVSIPPGEHTIVLPVSPYTIALFASVIPLMKVVRGWRLRS
jgi:hypothetical protein